MVPGLNRFREAFAAHGGHFTLIGGAVAFLWFENAGLRFRATKDLDVVLMIESVDDGFLTAFWRFVRDGGYQTKQRANGARGYYRFARPLADDFPAMIELFSKQPGGLAPLEGRDIVLIPPEEDASSLSAILMDPDYYGIVVRYRAVIDGLPLLAPAGLIALKARAWLDLTNRRERGEPVKSVDIKKHRNDIFRLSFLLAGDSRLDVPRRVREDLHRFLDLHPSTAESWREVGMALTASGLSVDPAEIIALLRRAFNAD